MDLWIRSQDGSRIIKALDIDTIGTTKHREFEFARYPKMKELYIKTFDKMLAEMPDDTNRTWKTGEDVFNWWLYGDENKSDDKQIKIEDLGDLIQQLTPPLM